MAPELWSDGVQLHLITSQPGDIRQKLLDRDVPAIPDNVLLSSDPERKLLVAEPVDSIYHWRFNDDHPPAYEMVNPALVVIDRVTGEVIKEMTWSWKIACPGVSEKSLHETYLVKGTTALVLYRPIISDLRSAIEERRQVRVTATQPLVHALAGYVKAGDPLPRPFRRALTAVLLVGVAYMFLKMRETK